MNRVTILALLFLLVLMLPICGLAQTEDELATQRAQAEAAAVQAAHEAEARQNDEMMQRGQAQLDEFLTITGGALPPRPLSAEAVQRTLFRNFRLAIPKFRKATTDFRLALGTTEKIGAPAKEIGVQIEPLLKYLDSEKLKHSGANASEFKDYSKSELEWETLNSAEKISAYLDIAVRAEQQQVVNTKTLEFLSSLEGELLRLKWLTKHVR